MIRFNTDSGHLEYYTGTHWDDVIVNNQELGDHNLAADRSGSGTGARGLFAGGTAPSPTPFVDTIDYISISTLGNAQDFGNLTTVQASAAGLASRTRGIFGGGYTPTMIKSIAVSYTHLTLPTILLV